MAKLFFSFNIEIKFKLTFTKGILIRRGPRKADGFEMSAGEAKWPVRKTMAIADFLRGRVGKLQELLPEIIIAAIYRRKETRNWPAQVRSRATQVAPASPAAESEEDRDRSGRFVWDPQGPPALSREILQPYMPVIFVTDFFMVKGKSLSHPAS